MGWHEVTLTLRYHDEALTPSGVSRCEPSNVEELVVEIDREVNAANFGGLVELKLKKLKKPTIAEAFAAATVTHKTISEHFGLNDICYELVDMRGHPWTDTAYGDIHWWYDTTPPEDINPEDPLFSTEQWLDRWVTDEYTLFYVYQDGHKEARVYENACKLQGDGPVPTDPHDNSYSEPTVAESLMAIAKALYLIGEQPIKVQVLPPDSPGATNFDEFDEIDQALDEENGHAK